MFLENQSSSRILRTGRFSGVSFRVRENTSNVFHVARARISMPSLKVVAGRREGGRERGSLTKRRAGTSKAVTGVSPVARSRHFSFNYSQLQRREKTSHRRRRLVTVTVNRDPGSATEKIAAKRVTFARAHAELQSRIILR